jgi:Tfp pilus assembly protein PilO
MPAKTMNLLCVSTLLVLVLGSYLGLFRPQMQRLAALHSQERSLQQQSDLHAQVRVGVDQLQAQITASERRLTVFDQQLPHDAQLETFLRQLDQVAQRTGFTMTLIKPGQAQPGELYGTVPIAITAESSFPAFYNFLTALPELPRLTKIDALSITRKPESPVCDISFTLLVYVAKAMRES